MNHPLDNAFANHSIAGRNYRLSKLPMMDAGRIAAKIGKTLLPGIAASGNVDGNNSAQIMKAVAALIENIDAECFYDDAMHCLKQGCTVNDCNIAEHHYFEKHFAQYPQDLFPCLIWALKENIGGFFDLGALSQSSAPATVMP